MQNQQVAGATKRSSNVAKITQNKKIGVAQYCDCTNKIKKERETILNIIKVSVTTLDITSSR